ncbi:MAG: hypothetical protein ACYS8W_07280 [Planctomycetota bacterium]|jgi:hypothetical protein
MTIEKIPQIPPGTTPKPETSLTTVQTSTGETISFYSVIRKRMGNDYFEYYGVAESELGIRETCVLFRIPQSMPSSQRSAPDVNLPDTVDTSVIVTVNMDGTIS